MQGVLPTRYAGSYLFVTILAIASCALLLGFRDQTQQGALSEKTSMGHSMVDDLPPRRLRAVAFQPTFLVGTAGSMIGYLTMMILMTIAPIAALQDHHTISQAAVAVQWHMVGMYAPALFTGLIIRSIGAAQTLLLGTMSTAAGAVIAVSGISQADFMAALALVGIGWCLMYIAGSTLIAHSYRHAERTRAQGLGEALTMAGAAAGGLSAAALFEALGWHNINLLMLVPLGVCAFITGAYLVNRAWRLVHKPLEEMASRQD
jgi:MFS family permease